MSDATIPWLLLGSSRRRALADRIGVAVEEWRRAWLPEHPCSIDVEIVEDARARPTDIRAHEASCFRVIADGDAPLALVVPKRSLAGLVGAPSHGADASSRFADDNSLAAALEREALLRLAGSLLSVSKPVSVSLERIQQSAMDVLRQYDASRFVCASIAIGDRHCVVDALLAPALVEAIWPVRPVAPDGERVERRRSAVGDQLVEIDGLLGMAEVSLSELAAMSVGDVIVLDQKLTDAGGLSIRGGERVGGAAPGRVDGMRAIQFKGKAA